MLQPLSNAVPQNTIHPTSQHPGTAPLGPEGPTSPLESLPTPLLQHIAEFTLTTRPTLDASSIQNLAASSPRLAAAMRAPYQGQASLFSHVDNIERTQRYHQATQHELLANVYEADLAQLRRAQNLLTRNVAFHPVQYFVPPRPIDEL